MAPSERVAQSPARAGMEITVPGATRALVVAHIAIYIACIWATSGAHTAFAQELGVTAEVERPIARTGGEDPTASATELDARARPRAMDTLEEALREVPGARALSTGAYGSPVTLSLRGADASQTEVLLGEVPLTSADGSAFDLSTIPLWALERVEVYRGGAPLWLGVSGMGGVLRLVPRAARGTRAEASAGAGSFGLGHGRLGASVEGAGVSWLATAGATASAGDYPLFDDGRTAFDPTDDGELTRENGHVREGSGLAHLSLPLAGGRLSVVGLGLVREGGVPGPASSPTRETRRHETTLLGGLAWELTEGGRAVDEADYRVAIGLAAGYRRRRLADRLGEVGLLPRSTDDEGARVLARVAVSGRALPWLELTGLLSYVREDLLPEDALSRQPLEASARDAGTLGAEARLFGRAEGVRMELRPSIRLALIGSRLSELRPERVGTRTDALDLVPTARLGAAIEPHPGVAISASFASATRAPSMVELFGDRAFLLGDAALRPERAESVDLGLVLRGREGPVEGHLEARGFASFASDLIRYRRNSQYQAVPENVASAVLVGGELGVQSTLTRHLAVAGALTLLETFTEHLGRTRQLPLRPMLTAYVRPEVRAFELGPIARLAVYVELLYVAESFWDPANTSALPERARLGVGLAATLFEGHVILDARLDDMLDARGTDLLGFPLPGRALSVGVTVRSQ